MTVTKKKRINKNKVQDKSEKIGKKLTPKQELFCRFYTQNDFMFGNATASYAEAYGFKLDSLSKVASSKIENEDGTEMIIEDSPYDKVYNTCCVNGSRLLRNANIDARIVTLLNELMTDEMVDAEIVKVMKQKDDYGAKLSAIREYNKLKQRVIDKKDITSGGKPIQSITGMEIIKDETPV